MSTATREATLPPELHQFVTRFVRELDEEAAAVFAGAGLSTSAGYVDWKGLLREIAIELGLSVEKEHDLVSLAQYHVNEKRSRAGINRTLIQEFSRGHVLTKNHQVLARLPLKTYWTTNYDKLLEEALTAEGKVVDVKHTVAQLAVTKPRRNVVLYKMHGDIDHPGQATVTKDDYECYFVARGPFVTALKGDLVSKTFLFIGFGFTDPNLHYILSRLRIDYGESPREHFCLLKTVARESGEKRADFEYRKRKQHHFINDLKRYNITALMIADYAQVTVLLDTIERRYRSRSVFISGSAADYGTWGAEKATAFLNSLAHALIQRDLRVVSGFGLGVGSPVIAGAMHAIAGNRMKHSLDELVLRPFPQAVYGATSGPPNWDDYRRDMLSRAGVAVFVFGNKHDEFGRLIRANGVEREFELALEAGLKPIPIGATGFVAQQLWQRVMDDFDHFYPGRSRAFQRHFNKLGTSKLAPAEVEKSLLAVLDALRGE